ncbi:MAG: T9SS type A sorting domain-containing protein [Bacteroidia bacterium]|nr:T9SS type A sorting domain-containing protein [Bacteroidia bacterium]
MKTKIYSVLLAVNFLLPNFSVAQTSLTPLWSPQITNNPSTTWDDPTSIISDATGVYVGGYDASNCEWRVEKRNLTSGALISTFGTGGLITSNPSTGCDYISAMAVDANYLYLTGVWANVSQYFRIEKRDKITGTFVSAFGTGGFVNGTVNNASPKAMTITATAIYVAGTDYGPGNNQWRIEKHDITTGALVSAFGTGGVITFNPSAFGSNQIYGITSDATGIYMAGSESSMTFGDSKWRVEKRDLTTGALISAFGTAGVVNSNPTIYGDWCTSITSDAGSLYIGGITNPGGGSDYDWRIEKRDKTTGVLVAAFGTAGVVAVSPSTGYDFLTGIIVTASGLFISGWDIIPGNFEFRIEKRDFTTGILSCYQTSNPTAGDDRANAMTADAGGIYVAGHDYVPGNAQWRVEKWDIICAAVLPVELINFTGYNIGTGNVLEWQTATETNNDYFILERSSVGIDFENIGTIDGHGNSTQLLNYKFNDNNPLSGINYYRLKQVDYNGDFNNSKTIAVRNNLSGIPCFVFQEELSGNFILSCSQPENSQAQILTMDGRILKVINITGNSENKISLNDFSSGISILRIIGEKNIQNFKLIKN